MLAVVINKMCIVQTPLIDHCTNYFNFEHGYSLSPILITLVHAWACPTKQQHHDLLTCNTSLQVNPMIFGRKANIHTICLRLAKLVHKTIHQIYFFTWENNIARKELSCELFMLTCYNNSRNLSFFYNTPFSL